MNPTKYPMKRLEGIIKELDKMAEECAKPVYNSKEILPNISNKLYTIKNDLNKVKKWLEET